MNGDKRTHTQHQQHTKKTYTFAKFSVHTTFGCAFVKSNRTIRLQWWKIETISMEKLINNNTVCHLTFSLIAYNQIFFCDGGDGDGGSWRRCEK